MEDSAGAMTGAETGTTNVGLVFGNTRMRAPAVGSHASRWAPTTKSMVHHFGSFWTMAYLTGSKIEAFYLCSDLYDLVFPSIFSFLASTPKNTKTALLEMIKK